MPERRVHLLTFPEELQVAILTDLDIDGLVACRQTCHALAEVIERTPVLVYKISLGRAAMVDNRSSTCTMKIVDRLKKLRAYVKSRDAVALPVIDRSGMNTLIPPTVSGGLEVRGPVGATAIVRRACEHTGIPARTWTVDVAKGVDADEYIESLVVDAGQDLVVVTTLEPDGAALCYVLSLSQLGAPHPAARMPVLDPGIDIGPYANVADVLHISGDLLAWTVFGEATELVLWNWKMGKQVWYDQYYDPQDPEFVPIFGFHILDPFHFVVVYDATIKVYVIDEQHQTDQESICLALPRLDTDVSIETYLKHSPVFSDCQPPFSRDPSATILVLDLSDCDGRARFALMIPITTLIDQAARPREQIVPWADWGCDGSRLVFFPRPLTGLAVMGSSCAAMVRDDGKPSESATRTIRAFVFDVHAHALEQDGQVRVCDDFDASDYIKGHGVFQKPVRTRFPFRITSKQMQLKCPSSNVGQTGVTFLHNGLHGIEYFSRRR